MSESELQSSLSVKKLRLGLLVVGLVLFGTVVGVFRQTAPQESAPQETAETADAAPAAPVVDAAPAAPDQFDPATWRSGNRPGEGLVDDVEQELSLADQLLTDGQLFQDDNLGALGRYASILRAHPDHPEAREGFDAVVSKLMEQLEGFAQRREIAAGTRIYQALRRAEVSDPELTGLGDRLEALEKSAGLIALAEADIQAGRLIEPAGRSALDRLRRATQLDPGSVALADRLVGLERRLIDRALAAAREMDFRQANRLLAGARRARGGSSGVDHAADQIQQFRRQRIEETSNVARLAMRDSRFPDAEEAIESVRSLGAEGELLATLDEELRLSRLYNIFRPGQLFSDDLAGGGEGPTMVVLPHGAFRMGASPVDPVQNRFERPAHTVVFGRGFALGQHEVTVAQFRQFIEATGYETDAEREGHSFAYSEASGRVGRRRKTSWRHAYNGRDAEPDLPVVHVSFSDAQAYARWLAEETGFAYRLPSEAEFEYALRGGRQTRYWWGDGTPTLAVENLTGEGDESPRHLSWTIAFEDYTDGFWGPAPVAQLSANPFGLYDIAGNVQEWVADCWHDSYVRAPGDGSAWVNRGCDLRVVRGTFWGGAPDTARASSRQGYKAETRGAAIGFRVARDLVTLPPQVANR